MSVQVQAPTTVHRVLASVAELQQAARPGTVRELVRMTSMEPMAVERILAHLVDEGLVVATEAGGVAQYRMPAERRLVLP